ncbi:MAG TPA: efflux RND transporter periplasmic adaptor subunit [Opitutaceae bacterium]
MHRNSTLTGLKAFALGSASLLFLAACSDKGTAARRAAAAAQVQAVEVVPIQRRDLVETLSLVGSIAPSESAQVRAEVTGLVRDIFFEEGQQVKKGQVLLKIDDTELRAQTMQAEASLKLAELSLQRSEALVKARNITQADHDRTQSEYNTALAQHTLQRSRLEKTEVKAPFDGVIGSRTISPGDYVNSQTNITTIDDLSRLKIDFQVPERFLRKVHTGTTFVVKSRALDTDAEVAGEVYFVSSIIERTTRSSEVKGYLANPPPDLKPGMFANIELVLDVRKGALTLPEGSIFTATSGTQVVAVRQKDGGSVADFVPVQLGLRSKGLVEITPVKEGTLSEGQPVVASGVGALVLFQGAKLEAKPLRKEFQLDGDGT